MKRHIVIHYTLTLVGLVFLLSVLSIVAGVDRIAVDSVAQSIIWGGLLAPVIVYVEFRYANLWPLYDNLRISRFATLAGLTLAAESLGVLLAVTG